MGKAVARSSKCALVREAMKDPGTKHYIITRIGLLVRKELQLLCSDKTNSVLKSQSVFHLREFCWDTFTSDLSTNAPILWSILYASTQTRRPAQNRKAVIGMCIALLLKLRYSKMCLVQKIISLILNAGNTGKQVFLVGIIQHKF